jgi:hypothetical protein
LSTGIVTGLVIGKMNAGKVDVGGRVFAFFRFLTLTEEPLCLHLQPSRSMAAGVASLLDWRSILIVALTVTVWLHYIRKKKTAPLPPGPRGLPFVGNILDLPPSHHWLKFAELGDIWGML